MNRFAKICFCGRHIVVICEPQIADKEAKIFVKISDKAFIEIN